MKRAKPLSVLLIEDDEVDLEALQRGFSAIDEGECLTVARSGAEALALLYNDKKQKKQLRRPFLVMLDLNMPQMNGFEILRILRDDKATEHTVVFVCTTSDSEADREKAFAHHIAGYISKSRVGTDWARVANLIREYWSLSHCPG